MAKLTLNTIGSRYGSIDALNDNSNLVEAAFENTLSRDGTGPNNMEADLDMDSNSIINVDEISASQIDVNSLLINGVPVAPTGLSFYGLGKETQVATSNQTVFTLGSLTYVQGINNIQVYVDGVYQNPSTYAETSTSSITFDAGLHVGAVVDFVLYYMDNLGYTVGSNATQYNPAGVGAVATNVQTKLREFVSIKDFGAVGDGITNDTAAINAALAASNSVYAPPGTYLTTGNHIITTQTFVGAGKMATVFKRSSGSNSVFLITGNGQLQNLTVDGDNTWGNGIVVSTTTYGELKSSVVSDIVVKNIGTTATPVTITGISNATQCQITAASHGFVAGDYVNIRTVTGLVSTSNPTKSVVSGLWKVKTATLNTFTIDLDTTSWTAYVSGGQVLRASFGICVERIGTGGYGDVKTLNNIELRDNDSHIYIGIGRFSTFNNVFMFGSNSRAAVYTQFIDAVWFNNTYMEGAIETFYYGVRDLTFNNLYINIQPSNTFTGALVRSIGMNYAEGQLGGEVAGLTFNNVSIYRAKNFGTQPIFEINPYQASFRHIHIYDSASTATWYVFALYGIKDWSLKDVTVESVNAWNLFDATWNLGYAINAENIRYTQGAQGTATWSNLFPGSGDSDSHIVVRGSNLNQAIKSGGGYGYWFENIQGNVNLTNAGQGGTFLFSVSGTVTDPNKAITFRVDTSTGLWARPAYTYADNTAALAGGLVAGQVYKTSTGVLMVVY